jgi:hypothetical protein
MQSDFIKLQQDGRAKKEKKQSLQMGVNGISNFFSSYSTFITVIIFFSPLFREFLSSTDSKKCFCSVVGHP